MNSKKNKNKKASKQPNPTPPQNEETKKIEEKIESEISDKANVVSDIVAEPVAEKISETVAENVAEAELPKKPKRNRGKKKKQDRDDDEKNEEKISESVKVADEKIETPQVEVIFEDTPRELPVAFEQLANQTEETLNIDKNKLALDNVIKSDPFEEETKFSKKKNKKKKRHDSDRSDKSGDALSCTAAFQQLLDVSDEKPIDAALDVESTVVAEKQIEGNILRPREDDKGPDVTTDVILQDKGILQTEQLVDESHESKEWQKHEAKSKKNKKDKKRQQKTEDIGTSINEPTKPIEGVCEAKSLVEIIQEQTNVTNIQNITNKEEKSMIPMENIESNLYIKPEEVPQISAEQINIHEITEREKDNIEIVQQDSSACNIDKESPKPKAKIAKPVDKKRKGKQEPTELIGEVCTTISDSAVLEQPSTASMLPQASEEECQKEVDAKTVREIKEFVQPVDQTVNYIDTSGKEEIKLDINPITKIVDLAEQQAKEITLETKEIIATEPQSVEIKNTPDNKTSKKKRKALKIPMPTFITPEPVKSIEEMTIELSKEGTEEVGDVESIFESLVPADIEVKSTNEQLNEILELKVEPKDNIESETPATAEQPEEKWTKPKRKGKKALKMPPTPGVSNEQFNLGTDAKSPEHIKEPRVTAQQSPIETLEIRSVKAEDSECSPCDLAPDIVYPRSTSQLNIDDNNNTVIREILMPDTLNIPMGLTSPLIQGSGETPIGTPLMATSFSITEMECPAEKTDLKSKVLEVNRDMEELRLSIERSLAEFTSIEKSEEEIEKIYEKTQAKNINLVTPERDIPKDDSVGVRIKPGNISPVTAELLIEPQKNAPLATQEEDLEIPTNITETEPKKEELQKPPEKTQCAEPPPVCPARRDNKGKSKKRKAKQETSQPNNTQTTTESSKDKKEEKTEQKQETKQQSTQETKQKDNDEIPSNKNSTNTDQITDYDPIENFEDALTTSVDDVDVNKTFEMILNEVTDSNQKELAGNKPDINITTPEEDFREGKVPQPKNLLGHPNIPVSSNKDDFKKEKHKNLNTQQAKVKIKDANNIETKKQSKQSQTEIGKISNDFSLQKSNRNGDFIYKYSFRKVFLQNTCHVCSKELSSVRVPCNFCNLLFYCSIKHKDEDWPHHQGLCFAISTIVHLKDQKHIYAEAKNITGQNYRLLRMQMILSCEKVLKRRLVPWEQEALLYPRICADVRCREWRQSKLKDCEGCGQISYCANSTDHLPLSHQRWCKSYALYQKLVMHQQTKGRLEPKLPTKVMSANYEIPEKINEVLASMYEEEIDMNDIQYAALTQIATAPLTVAYSHQLYRKATKPSTNGIYKKSSFVIHVLGAELQFEADVLNKWEVFFLHLRPDVNELVVVLISNNLNPGNLPLELLGKISLCESCQQGKRRVIFSFQDKKSYQEYRTSEDFIYPDIVCAFNASINRSSYNIKDQWPGIISSVMRLRSPFLITSHTPTELHRDLIRVKECSDVKVVVDPQRNSFASVRPDRNFITDDEAPLLFKNQCFAVLCGV